MTPSVGEVMRTAYSLYKQGQFDEAMAAWREALCIDSKLAEAHFSIGNVLVAQDKTEEALEEWQQALQLNPDFAKAHYNRGVALCKQNKEMEALDEWHEALRLTPDYWEAYAWIGEVFAKRARRSGSQSDWKKCLDAQRQVVKYKTGDAYLHAYIGSIEMLLSDAKAAISSFKTAIHIAQACRLHIGVLEGHSWN